MICKGKGRTNGDQLGKYLGNYLEHEKNDLVQVLEVTGTAFHDLGRSLASWEAEAKQTKCKKALWHAQICPAPGERLTREQKIEAVNILEKKLGFEGQPRAVVVHTKKSEEHIHVVWSRIDRTTKKARRDDFTHRKNVEAAREMEERFGLFRVESPEFKNDDKSKKRAQTREESKKAPTYSEFQKAKRTKLDPRERKATITGLWHSSDTGKAFQAALQDSGYILARGQRRDYVVVDKAGDVHSLPRQIKDANTDQVRERLRDIDPASIPLANHIQQQMRRAFRATAAEQDYSKQKKKEPGNETRGESPNPHITARVVSIDRRDPNSLKAEDILTDLTKSQSTFTLGDLQYLVGRRLLAQEGAEKPGANRMRDIIASVRSAESCLSLGLDRVGSTRYTTRQMLGTELAMRDASDVLARNRNHSIKTDIRESAPTARKLEGQQRAAYNHVTGDTGLSLVIGYAGTGKSFMLGAAREAWEAQGYRVTGLALSGMAAESLQNGSRIESRTLASMFKAMENLPEREAAIAKLDEKLAAIPHRTQNQRKLRCDIQSQRDQQAARADKLRFTKRDVIVLDEAAMVGSRDMDRLLNTARNAGAKVVLVGDAEQLQAIDAGGALRALTERHGAVKISDIRRQKADWQQQATKDFGDGFTMEALGNYRKNGHIHESTDQETAREKVISAWKTSRKANPNDSHLMMAFTREDVASLNRAGRSVYKDEGRLGLGHNVETEAGNVEFARGDRMYFLENNRAMGVKNGSLGTIEKIVPYSVKNFHQITVKLDNGGTVEFKTNDYSKFAHGYASTVHRSQGTTADRTHLLASKYMDRHATYVGMTRHTERVDMFYSARDFDGYGGLAAYLSRDRRKDTTLDYIKRAELEGRVEQFWSRVKTVAKVVSISEQRERAALRLAVRLGLKDDPAIAAELAREKEELVAKRKLWDALFPGRKQERQRYKGMEM